MPHVVIEGKIEARRVAREVVPLEARDRVALYKVREAFLDRSGRHALLDTIVVEGATRRFFISVEEHAGEGRVTVRIHQVGDPERTPGVKRAVARVARRLLALDPGARVVATNLAAELEELAT